ncbi:hypothetical protein INT48_000878 [Thamnidium elegans]|uniref:Uncharacterized protein n=1 Tax=Thamnidium elegans TaxID=101142 RepID=A0A8H7SYP9_9FUNG|nr:hypothetical protein INT48_000878 [Thamnidium elegans]
MYDIRLESASAFNQVPNISNLIEGRDQNSQGFEAFYKGLLTAKHIGLPNRNVASQHYIEKITLRCEIYPRA